MRRVWDPKRGSWGCFRDHPARYGRGVRCACMQGLDLVEIDGHQDLMRKGLKIKRD